MSEPKTLGEMLAEDKAEDVVDTTWGTWVSAWLQLNELEDHVPLEVEAVGEVGVEASEMNRETGEREHGAWLDDINITGRTVAVLKVAK